MSWYYACDDCCVWIEASPCGPNPDGLRVFVRHDDPKLNGTVIFKYGQDDGDPPEDLCWSVNASAVPTFLPKGDKVRIVTLGATYTSCTACEEDDDDPPSDGGPGGGSGGPGGGGPGGPGGGGPGGGGAGEPGDGESEFVKLIVCFEHAGLYAGPDLYSSPPDEERFVRLYGYCFRVPTGPTVEEIPEGAHCVYTGGSYDDCHDCAYGKKARLCPDQEDIPGYDDAPPPEIWVRSRDLPDETIGFTWGSFCYELRASDPDEVVPIGAFILNPRGQFADCSECRVGIQCQPCPGEPDVGYEVWVEAKEAEAFSTTVFFRYRAVCYSLDPTATPSRIPFDAHVVVPRDEYVDCDTCQCGERTEHPERGINCANHNPYTQFATATARIFVPRATLMTVNWSGQGETQDPGFELMSLYVNGQLVGSAHAPGGGQGCGGGMGPVVSNPQPPQQRVLAAGEHTLSISATTNDPLYHVGAWYRFDLTFSDLPEAP